MSRLSRFFRILAAALLILGLFPQSDALAKPTTADQAQKVVRTWLLHPGKHLGTELGQEIKGVQTFRDKSGGPLYHVISLNPAGLIVVPGDDLVEPIVAFLPQGEFVSGDGNPLGALVNRDLPGRLARLRQLQDTAKAQGRVFTPKGGLEKAQRKWDKLQKEAPPALSGLGPAEISEPGAASAPSISEVRVPPLVQSQWSQGGVGSKYCYNYYTPNHYPCGCVATALAQLMRYHQHPAGPSALGPFLIRVNDNPSWEYLSGWPYNWGLMPPVPTTSSTEDQLQAIGTLTYDAGVAVNMEYTASGSAAYIFRAADALTSVFGYGNAARGYNWNNDIPGPSLNNMVNPNLDAELPVILGITGPKGAHAVLADGYGYDLGTPYHHLNMGWGGLADVWYNLPNVDSGYVLFDAIYECLYNIYPGGHGEIVSGRVTDGSGNPLSGAAVTAVKDGGGMAQADTNQNGIYALTHLDSASTYTISVTAPGYTFEPQTVATGISTDNSTTTGNVWGVDFTAGTAPLAANFTPSLVSGRAPLLVQFTNTSSGAVTGCSWDFGDGGTSTDASPSHTYTIQGTYLPTLTVTGVEGTSSKAATIKVGKAPKPKARFTAYPTRGLGPLQVQFTNTSTGPIDSYLWDFGDGTAGTDPNPSHTYTIPGKYKARLTVTGLGGTRSKARTIKVEYP